MGVPREVNVPDQAYNIRQVAVMFGVHSNTIWRWVREGTFPKPWGNGRTRRWWGSDLKKKQSEMR